MRLWKRLLCFVIGHDFEHWNMLLENRTYTHTIRCRRCNARKWRDYPAGVRL